MRLAIISNNDRRTYRMAKKKQTKKLTWEQQHLRNVARYERQIDDIYREAAREAASIGATIKAVKGDTLFSFADYPLTRKRVDSLLSGLTESVEAVILNGVRASWTLANNKNNELSQRVFGDNVGKLTQAQYRRYFSDNDEARQAFEQRKVNGMNLSNRVWRYTDQFKEEIEMGLDVGIRNGLSADQMARELNQYLQHPDMLFRRVRDEHGMLQLSQRAAAYHPGQGVYRSSYKNCRRLAATETNIAYHTADHLRWQDLDFVVGIEIHLSSNHTLLGQDGLPHDFTDICDELAGRYPKDFKFTGWHPHCRCYATSILKTPEELEEDTRKILNGEELDGESVNRVDDVPDEFKSWVQDNTERVKYHSSLPYFLSDNPRYLPDGFINSVGTLRRDADSSVITDIKEALIKIKDPTFITEREVKNMITSFATANPTLFYGGLNGVKTTTKEDMGFMANTRTYEGGSYKVSKGNTITISKHDFNITPTVVFNPMHEVKSAMRAISEGRKFTFNEEYALESIWHEMRHAAAVGWKDLSRKSPLLTSVMETVNQYCARRSYGTFVTAIGGKVSNKAAILTDGYGYSLSLRNFGKVLDSNGISQSAAYSYLKDRILTTPYEDIMETTTEFLIGRGLKRTTAETLLKGLRLSDNAFDKLLMRVK